MDVPAAPSGAETGKPDGAPQRSKDEVALELMKFVAVTTGYGKGTGAAGFSGKPGKSAEEYAEALLELFDRCRTIVAREPKAEK
jgi:hypothetical protein